MNIGEDKISSERQSMQTRKRKPEVEARGYSRIFRKEKKKKKKGRGGGV